MTVVEKGKDAAEWQVRAAACELLALSLRYPDAALSGIVASGEWADAACEIWGMLGIELPAGWASGVENADLHAFRVEATRLFVGAPHAACNPCEGYWRAKDDGVQPLMFVNPHTMAVERFCRACGLRQAEGGSNEPLDHIATEFELLQYLASVEAGLVQLPDDGPDVRDFPGGGAAAAYDRFMADHMRAFAPRFAACLAKQSHMPYYQAVAYLLSSYLE